ncbi:WD repeat-containing protein 92 [Perkinsus chesapeaki]|uniref:WD repeat-containing protein 92 n=1 Tax=Perkinsus chesapeaki TaxID=330153 RepID=A0A7J6MXG7_PERCH|nr:WD repeat-containing protein 92 [Perkinsus chesapeaki]
MDTTSAPQLIEHINEPLNFTPFDVRWIPRSARFALMGQFPKATGVVRICEMDQGKLTKLVEKEWPVGVKCGSFGASPSYETRHLTIGDYGGRLTIFDVDRMDKPFYSVKAHDSIINTLDGCKGPGPVEIVTGSRDGSVKIWDPRTAEPVVCLEPVPDARAASAGVSVADCWAVGFGNAYNEVERTVAAGYDNGDVKLFDLRTMQLRWDTNVKNGVTHVAFDRKDIKMNKLAVSCLEATMIIYDMRTYNPTSGYSGCLEKVLTKGENQKNQPQGGAGTVWGCHFLPQNRDVWCTAGGSGGLFLHKYNYPMERETRDKNNNPVGVAGTVELLNQRDVSTQPIVAFDWHPDKLGLAVMGSLDQTVKVAICTKLNLY